MAAMTATRTSVGVKRRVSGEIDLVPILKAIGHESILDGPDRKQISRLFRRLSDARAHYNTRLDFDLPNQELSHRANSLAGVERIAADLSQRLGNRETVYELRTLWPDRISSSRIPDKQEVQDDTDDDSHFVPSLGILRNGLRALKLHARDRRRAIEKTAKRVPVKGGLNAELTAYLAVVFEEIFANPASYAREQKEDASANKFGRFVNAVFEQFGLKRRKHGSIANDLTKMRPRIQELKRIRRITQ
jgi:hypothetical protein